MPLTPHPRPDQAEIANRLAQYSLREAKAPSTKPTAEPPAEYPPEGVADAPSGSDAARA